MNRSLLCHLKFLSSSEATATLSPFDDIQAAREQVINTDADYQSIRKLLSLNL